MKTLSVFGGALLLASLATAPTADALPGPMCPGDGTDITVVFAGGGYCDFMFLPDGHGAETHVHCEWGGVLQMWNFISINNCWRVNADGSKIPAPPPPQRDLPFLPPPPEQAP